MIKNSDVDFSSLPLDDQRSFCGLVRKELLLETRKLYRFATPWHNAVAPTRFSKPVDDVDKEGRPIKNAETSLTSLLAYGSPFWIPHDVFHQITKLHRSSGQSIIDVAKMQLAVKKEFNPTMETMCVVELKISVFGFRGKTAPQLDGAKELPGGFEQYCIPNLYPADLRFVHFGWIA